MNEHNTDHVKAPSPYLSRTIVSGDPYGERAFFFPINAVLELPASEEGADILAEVQGDDTHYYFVKGNDPEPRVAASELVSAQLAELINLPVPTPKIVRLQRGTLVFGSRQIATIGEKVDTAAILTSMSLPPSGFPIPGLRQVLAESYAFDLFINNVDRHEKNFMCCRHDGRYRLYLIDHARALFSRGYDVFPPVGGYGTIFTARRIRERHGFDLPAALALVDKLERVARGSITRILDSTPDNWLPPVEKEQFVDWWVNGGRARKMERLRNGLCDGSLL
ncbi:MAG: HipA family kinase [Methylocystis sp.]|uniref:HipA family kinase n=1 Tax=Methylocystis sp. TaxID=1911079 RepID=UPI003DA35BBD